MNITNSTIHTQMLGFQRAVGIIKKDSTNPHFKNTYASLAQILGEVKPVLSDFDLVLTQPIDEQGVHTIVTFGTEQVKSSIPLPTGLTPQQLGSAITYFRRYTLAALLALEIDDDDAEGSKQPVPVRKSEPARVVQATNGKTPPPPAPPAKKPEPAMAPEKKEDVRPWLTEGQFKKAIDRVTGGDLDCYHKTVAEFRMKRDYRTALDGSFEFSKSLA